MRIIYLDIRAYPPEEYEAEVLALDKHALCIVSERDGCEGFIRWDSVIRILQQEEGSDAKHQSVEESTTHTGRNN
jgi:hypothetical protein